MLHSSGVALRVRSFSGLTLGPDAVGAGTSAAPRAFVLQRPFSLRSYVPSLTHASTIRPPAGCKLWYLLDDDGVGLLRNRATASQTSNCAVAICRTPG